MDDRTHDSTSAINDELHSTPLPRGEGADAPQSDLADGKGALYYTEQNFNELVAANTAMTSELAARDAVIAEKDQIIADLRDRNADYKRENERHEQAFDRGLKEVGETRKKLSDEMEAHAYTRSLLEAANRRVERASGYIDRVLDDESRLDDAPKETRPLPKDPIGPDLRGIYDPRPPRRQDSDNAFSFEGAVARTAYHAPLRERRY